MVLGMYRVFLIFSAFFLFAKGQVDKACTLRNTGHKGVCKVDISCPKAKEDAERGIQPTICGILYGSIIVVCCEGANKTDIQPSDDSFLGIDLQDDKIVYETENDNQQNSNIPLSERKCLEYNKNTMQSVEVIPLISNPRPSSVLITKCNYDGIPLIVGGAPASPGEFPFMAVLGYTGSDDEIQWNCGGTLISDFYVMTAAHCVFTKNGSPVLVRLGELDLASHNDNSVDFGVNEVRPHPDYHSQSKVNDIALIKLSKQVSFTNYTRPACLWNRSDIKHTSAIATGWGVTENGGGRSDLLQKVSLDILDKSICDRTYKHKKYYRNGLPPTMLCAGELKGGKDTCQGDSGGPLSVTKENNQCIFYTVGITSFGRLCALENTPAVYTKVSEYVSWIESIVWK